MGVEVKKKTRESSSVMLRRFSRKLRMSGILLEARKKRFLKKNESKNLRRKSALRREKIKKEIERKKRLGIL